jgi:hypothetical protein
MVPFGKPQYLRGNVHTLDVLKVKDNEGPDAIGSDFALLFAASGHMRNVIISKLVPARHLGTQCNEKGSKLRKVASIID